MVTERFERCRRQAGLSLGEAAIGLDVADEVLESFEKGEREPDALMLRHMASMYGCTSDQLLGIVAVGEVKL